MLGRKFAAYYLAGTETPWAIIILDFEWIEDNRSLINSWFDLNAPESKPRLDDSVIHFTNEQYTMWRMAWEH